jgi:hypothetical protein
MQQSTPTTPSTKEASMEKMVITAINTAFGNPPMPATKLPLLQKQTTALTLLEGRLKEFPNNLTFKKLTTLLGTPQQPVLADVRKDPAEAEAEWFGITLLTYFTSCAKTSKTEALVSGLFDLIDDYPSPVTRGLVLKAALENNDISDCPQISAWMDHPLGDWFTEFKAKNPHSRPANPGMSFSYCLLLN